MRPLNYIMHIPKTAGMSLQGLVRRRHKTDGSLELVYSKEHLEKGFTDHPKLETVMGHFRFGFNHNSDRKPRYFVFLRDPVNQVISHYYYSLEKPEKFEDLPENISSVVEFARSAYGYNLQTRFISGIDQIKDHEDEAVARAKWNLSHHFEMVGLTEKFDQSLLLMGQHLNWQILFYARHNEGRHRKQNPPVSAEEIGALKEILWPDLQVYDWGRKIFERQYQAVPASNIRLQGFRIGNRLFQFLNPTYTRLKEMLGKAGDPHEK